MSAPWFFHSDIPPSGQVVSLDRAEAKHAAGSKRLHNGDAIVLFDGAGTVARGTLITGESKRDKVAVGIESVDRVTPIEPAVTVASAVPKGDRLSTLLSMLAQLGVRSFVPLQCDRSVAEGGRGLGSRGQRIVLEACKQARCPFAMRIEPPVAFAPFMADAVQHSVLTMLADASGGTIAAVIDGSAPEAITAVVGPEGGFSEQELDTARALNVPMVSLGSTTLRIETACIAFASTIRASFGA